MTENLDRMAGDPLNAAPNPTKAADEFNTYIANNSGMIPNNAERRRDGELIAGP